jgi:hypothetical protein
MKRLALVSTLLLVSVSCADFVGRHGVLGFGTSASLGNEAWSYEHRMAAGPAIDFGTVLDVSADKEVKPEDFEARWWGKADATFADGHLLVSGNPGDRSLVRFTGQGLSDEFLIRFAQADDAALIHPAHGILPIEPDFVVLADTEVDLNATVLDRRGRRLGYDPAALSVRTHGDASAWVTNGTVRMEASNSFELDLIYDGVILATETLTVVTHDDIDRVEDIQLDLNGDILNATIAFANGAMVLGYPIEDSEEGESATP